MRPIEGTTLADLVKELREDRSSAREKWSIGRLVRLFLQAANAIAFAHSRRVIHRDLKPANIMIGPFEEVLVLDWGMAKVLGTGTEEPPTETNDARIRELTAESESRHLVGTLGLSVS